MNIFIKLPIILILLVFTGICILILARSQSEKLEALKRAISFLIWKVEWKFDTGEYLKYLIIAAVVFILAIILLLIF